MASIRIWRDGDEIEVWVERVKGTQLVEAYDEQMKDYTLSEEERCWALDVIADEARWDIPDDWRAET